MATKFKFYSQEKSMKNIKSSVFCGFMYIGATKSHKVQNRAKSSQKTMYKFKRANAH